MNRRIAAWALAAVTLLGLTACSGNPATTTAPPTPTDTAATAPSKDKTASQGQSVSEACLSMAGPLAEASAAMAKIASISANDAQSAVDVWSELVDAFRTVSETVANPEVKDAAGLVYKDLAALRDAMQKVYVDGDIDAMTDFSKATSQWQSSYTALNKLCAA